MRHSLHARSRPRNRRAPWLLVLVVATAVMAAFLPTISSSAGHRGPRPDLQLLGSSGTTSTTTSTSTTTTTTTVPSGGSTPPPVPSNFTTQLDNYYGALYNVVTSVPGASSASSDLASPSSFSSQVADMTPTELSDYYSAASQYENFSGQMPTLQQISSDAANAATALRVHMKVRPTRVARRSSPAVVTHQAGSEVVAQSLTVIPPTEPTTGSWAGDVSGLSLTYQATCPAGAPTNNDPYGNYDIFALNEGLAAALAVFNVLGAGNPLFDLPLVGPGIQLGFAIAAAVAAAVVLALQIAHDTLAWVQGVATDCQSLDIQQLTLDEDNNAFQAYQLLTGVAATANEVDTNIANLTNQQAREQANLTTLQIEEALSAPTGSVPEAQMELPAPEGLLTSTPGVEEVVVNTVTAMSNAGQLTSGNATRYLGLAEQAQSAGEYKLAFSYYQLAYQAASS